MTSGQYVELFIWQGRVKDHICLDIHSLLDKACWDQEDEIRIKHSRMGIAVGDVKIDLFVQFSLCTPLGTVEQQVLPHVGHTRGAVILKSRANTDQ